MADSFIYLQTQQQEIVIIKKHSLESKVSNRSIVLVSKTAKAFYKPKIDH